MENNGKLGEALEVQPKDMYPYIFALLWMVDIGIR